ncbi:uncharacterized protein HKW66_Vig0247840 [Vigna angularis]|uniref:Uncharacterized protein n=1 Tax=Phaseolus angularis TaxID=3914 RepID=A0A8T0KSI2_PHAAN|nr:uncharacterized protein HKW66_Vig0247840 [Vigna angularis]
MPSVLDFGGAATADPASVREASWWAATLDPSHPEAHVQLSWRKKQTRLDALGATTGDELEQEKKWKKQQLEKFFGPAMKLEKSPAVGAATADPASVREASWWAATLDPSHPEAHVQLSWRKKQTRLDALGATTGDELEQEKKWKKQQLEKFFGPAMKLEKSPAVEDTTRKMNVMEEAAKANGAAGAVQRGAVQQGQRSGGKAAEAVQQGRCSTGGSVGAVQRCR